MKTINLDVDDVEIFKYSNAELDRDSKDFNKSEGITIKIGATNSDDDDYVYVYFHIEKYRLKKIVRQFNNLIKDKDITKWVTGVVESD